MNLDNLLFQNAENQYRNRLRNSLAVSIGLHVIAVLPFLPVFYGNADNVKHSHEVVSRQAETEESKVDIYFNPNFVFDQMTQTNTNYGMADVGAEPRAVFPDHVDETKFDDYLDFLLSGGPAELFSHTLAVGERNYYTYREFFIAYNKAYLNFKAMDTHYLNEIKRGLSVVIREKYIIDEKGEIIEISAEPRVGLSEQEQILADYLTMLVREAPKKFIPPSEAGLSGKVTIMLYTESPPGTKEKHPEKVYKGADIWLPIYVH